MRYQYVTDAEHERLLLKAFPNFDTRPFHKWVRTKVASGEIEKRPPGPGSQITGYYHTQLQRYMTEVK